MFVMIAVVVLVMVMTMMGVRVVSQLLESTYNTHLKYCLYFGL